MKKIISVLLLILIIFILEFNCFRGLLPGAYAWIETILAFLVMAGVLIWNGFHKKQS